jgi:hypothetical protein
MFYDRNLQLLRVIYDRNDSGLYYKTTIIGNLTLATILIYDRKVRSKLKCTLRS